MDNIKNILNENIDFLETTILVSGKSGSGKSTLIKTVFKNLIEETPEDRVGLPVTEQTKVYSALGGKLKIIDTIGYTLSDNYKKIKSDSKRTIDKQNVDIMWYVINGAGNRIEEDEINFINSISDTIPVIIVISQTVGTNAIRLAEEIKKMNLKSVAILNILARDFYLLENNVIKAFGIDLLLENTIKELSIKKQETFISAQEYNIDLKVKLARRWSKTYIGATFGVGFAPIPYSDAPILVPLQVTMFLHIAKIFGISQNKDKLTALLSSVIMPETAKLIGRSVSSNLLKFIPGAGTIISGLINGTTAASVTYLLVEAYIKSLKIYLKNGNTNIDDGFIKTFKDNILKLKKGKNDE